jgi:hypothetical protein
MNTPQSSFTRNPPPEPLSTTEPYMPTVPKATYDTGDSFLTMADARLQVKTSLLDHWLSWKVDKADSYRTVLKCCGNIECDFLVRITASKKTGIVTITINHPHSCNPTTHQNFSERNAVWYLERHQAGLVALNRKVTSKDLASVEQSFFHNNMVPYKQFWRMRNQVIDKLDGIKGQTFGRFPAYAERFKEADPKNVASINLDPETNKFRAAFFCPASCQHAVEALRPIYFTDGTHTFDAWNQILLVAIGIDANRRGVVLGWALVPVENDFWWEWFLDQLALAMPLLRKERSVWMTDRQKGLLNAVKTVFPRAAPSHCCQHIADNVESKFGKALRKPFWNCAYALSKKDFESQLDKIKKVNLECGKYINNIPHETWATYAFPLPRYGHLTSNVVESLNGQWKQLRTLPPLQMMDAIYQFILKQWLPRYLEPQKSTHFADKPQEMFTNNLAQSTKYHAIPSNAYRYQVEIPNTPIRWVIDLRQRGCSCKQWKEFGLPCAHACKAITVDGGDYYNSQYYDKCLSIEALRYTYSMSVKPFTIEDLEIDDKIAPPDFQKPAGRPKTKRIRRRPHHGDVRKIICGRCGQLGDHNKASCTNAPKENGRAQRRHQYQLDRDTEVEDKGSEPDNDESSDNMHGSVDSAQLSDTEYHEVLVEMAREGERDPEFLKLPHAARKTLMERQVEQRKAIQAVEEYESEINEFEEEFDGFSEWEGINNSDNEVQIVSERRVNSTTPPPSRRRRASQITSSPTTKLPTRQSKRQQGLPAEANTQGG